MGLVHALRGRAQQMLVVAGAAVIAVVPFAMPAAAAGTVDIDTSLLTLNDQPPVPGLPVAIQVVVNNDGTAAATNVVADVPVPSGATFYDASSTCHVAAGHALCNLGTVAANDGQGALVYFTWATTGTRTVTSTARADQPDADGTSSDSISVTVVAENADLFGTSTSKVVVLGSQPQSVSHDFTNNGPTGAAGATIAGSVTGGGTIVPGSFHYQGSVYRLDQSDHAAADCTVSATTFTCRNALSGSGAVEPFVFYQVQLPTTPSTVVASATITGRADPNQANDTSTFAMRVIAPAAEIWTQLEQPGPVASAQPFDLIGFVQSTGQLDAADLVATMTVPAGWSIALPASAPPAGVTCAIQASSHAMRCTRAVLAVNDSWNVVASITPPAGTGSGVVTFAVTTSSPQNDIYPDSDSQTVQFKPPPTLSVTPATGLADRDTVTVTGTNLTPNAAVGLCEGIVAPSAPSCGAPSQFTSADANGHFTVSLSLVRFLVVNEVGVVDCAQPGSACGVAALDFASFKVVAQPISFTPQPPVADPFNARITGRVTDAQGAPVANAPVWAFRASDSWFASVQATTDANGNYDLEAAQPGITYRIVFGAPTGSDLLTEWYGGAASNGVSTRSAAFGVRLNATAPVYTADAVLAGGGGTIAGRVTDASGAPVAHVTVWGYTAADGYVGSYGATTAADGTYELTRVSPNVAVRLRFGPPAGSALGVEWFDNALTRATATDITLLPGGSATANEQLGPAG